MAVDVFLKIKGIPGESTDSKHKDEIDVLSYSWGLNNPARGPARAEDFMIIKQIDLASPALIEACCSGEPIDEVQVVVRKAGGGQQEYIKYTMEDVLISSVTPRAGAGDLAPMEEIALSFGKIEMEYQPQDPKSGQIGGWVKSSCSPRGRRGF